MNVVAIVQARTDSARFPGKVMKEILDKPMLWHLINRVKRCRLIDNIVVATTDNQQDRPILELVEGMGVDRYEGSADDVLDRFYQAAREYAAEVIVRITGDCPLIDPDVTDEVIGCYVRNRFTFDYVHTGGTFPEGLGTEVFSFTALKRAWSEARWLSEREHVTPFIRNSGIFRCHTMEYVVDLSHMRWVVDDDKDFLLVTEIFKGLYKEGEIFHLKKILNFLNKRQELLELNKRTVRNGEWLESLSQDRLVR